MQSSKALRELADKLADFADQRDWEQFHSPKNLSMALTVEAAELQEHFQWLSDEASRDIDAKKLAAIRDEIGDVLIYLVRLAEQFQIDLVEAASDKFAINEQKYPADRVRGKAKKYTEYE